MIVDNAHETLAVRSGAVKLPDDGLPPFIDAADAIPNDWREPAEVVQGLLHQGSKMVLGGGSKSCKTWALLDLAMSVSHGLPWWGFPTNKGKVLYLNFEIQKEFFHKKRIRPVADARQIQLQHGNLIVLNLRGKSANFSLLLPLISERIKGADYSLVILDPIYKGMAGRDENKAGDIADLLNQIEALAVDTGAAVAFGAHFSKGNQAGKESIDRISGSGVFARDPDTILVMTKHQEENAFTVDATLRNFPQVQPFCVRWQYPLMVRDGELDPSQLKQAKGGRFEQKYEPEQLLGLLADGPLTVAEWCSSAMEEFGVARRTFYTLKAKLIGLRKVQQIKGKRWKLTI